MTTKTWKRTLADMGRTYPPPKRGGLRPIHDSDLLVVGDTNVVRGFGPSRAEIARAEMLTIDRAARERGREDDNGEHWVGIRGRKGRFISAVNVDADGLPEYLFWQEVGRAADFMFGQPNPRPVPGLTYRTTQKQAAQARRDLARTTICPICEAPMVGKRSNAKTCGKAACHKALQRRQQGAKFYVASSTVYDRAVPPRARHIEGGMDPLHQLLDQTIAALWRLPLPPGYPDEVGWRKGQARMVRDLLALEQQQPSPSIARLRKRCRACVAQQRRFWPAKRGGESPTIAQQVVQLSLTQALAEEP